MGYNEVCSWSSGFFFGIGHMELPDDVGCFKELDFVVLNPFHLQSSSAC